MYIPFDLSKRHHVILFSRLASPRFATAREAACIFPRALQAKGSVYDLVDERTAATASSTSAEFAEGAERRTREGVAAVIGAVIRHNTEPVSSRVLRYGRVPRRRREKWRNTQREGAGRAELSMSIAEVIVLFLSCYYVYHRPRSF